MVAAQLFFIGLYMAIPLLTSYYIYYEGASLLSKGLAGVSTIASLVSSAVPGGAAAAAASQAASIASGAGVGGNSLSPKK
jgi:hypothetical protein